MVVLVAKSTVQMLLQETVAASLVPSEEDVMDVHHCALPTLGDEVGCYTHATHLK